MNTNISDDWKTIIDMTELKEIEKCIRETTAENEICPHPRDWLRWTMTEPKDIKVIIIGMDPYTRLRDAHGLCFSSPTSIPPSLRNIYKCLRRHRYIDEEKYPGTVDGDLTNWAKQGVLLLNVAFSTRVKVTGSHMHIWESFSTKLVENISEFGKQHGIRYIYMLWGNRAQSMEDHIDSDHHIVFKWNHPSPLAQSRCRSKDRFEYCDHFDKANELLGTWGKSNIIWDPRFLPE